MPSSSFPVTSLSTITSTSTRISLKAQPLWILNFNPQSLIQHWGIFLSGPDCNTTGTMWDMVIDKYVGSSRLSCASIFVRHGSKRKHHCHKRENFDLWRALQEGKQVFEIGNPTSTPERINAATKQIENDFKYSFAHQNCQSFVIETLKLLHAWDPAMVPQQTITMAQARTAFTVRAATSLQTPKTTQVQSRPKFTSSSEQLALADRTFRLPPPVAGRRGAASDPLPRNLPLNPQRRTKAYSDPRPLSKRPRRKGADSDPLPRFAEKPVRPLPSDRWAKVTMSEDREQFYSVPGAW